MSAEDAAGAAAWDENADPLTSAARVTMSALRKAPRGALDLIATVPGVG